MAAVREEIVAREVGLRILGWLPCGGAADDVWLHGIGHGIAMRRVTIPRFEREHLPHFALNEAARSLQAGIEALHVANHHLRTAGIGFGAQRIDFLHAHAERFLAQYVLPGANGGECGRHMKHIGCRDDDRVDCAVGQHRVVR